MTTKIDRRTPSFPVVRINLTDRPATITSGGQRRPLPQTDDATVIQEIATEADILGRPVRSTVTTETGTARLIVTPTGESHELTPGRQPFSSSPSSVKGPVPSPKQPRAKAEGPRSTARWMLFGGIALGLVVVLVIGFLVTVRLTTKEPEAAPTGPGPAPAAGELYAVPAPPTFGRTAAWQLPIATDTAPAVSDQGTAVVTPVDRSITGDLDAHTDTEPRFLSYLNADGQAAWSSPLPNDSSPEAGPLFSTVDEAPVVVMVWRDQLTYWPLNGAEPTTVDLPRRADVSFEGSSPLIVAEEKGYTVSSGQLIEHPVPYLTAPVAANGSVISAAEPNGTWWSVPETGTPTLTAPTVPKGASVASQVITLTADHAVILWQTPGSGDRPGPDTIVGVHDLATGEVQATAEVPNSSITRSAPLVRNEDGTQLSIGPVIFSTTEDGMTARVQDDLTPISSVGNTVYGTVGQDLISVAPGEEDATLLPPTTALPWGTMSDHAVVVADSTLYALTPSPTTEEE